MRRHVSANENFTSLLVNSDTARMIFSIELWSGVHALFNLIA
jgi:hypothetical protein